MKKGLTHALLTLAILALCAHAEGVKACSCRPLPSPYKAYKEARAVFVGKVLSSTDVPISESVGDQTYTIHEQHYRLAVEESFKGTKTSEVEVSAGRTDSSCFGGLTVGETYLIYSYNYSGNDALEVHTCSRTNNLTWARADVYYLRALLRGEPEPRVYGAITRADNDLRQSQRARSTPLEGIKVIVEGEGRRFEAMTDKQGLYRIDHVPDGRYKAHPEVPNKYRVYFPAEEEFILGAGEQQSFPEVQQGDGVYAGFSIGWNNRIGGRLLDAEGNLLRRAKAAVLSARRDGPPLVIEEEMYDYHPDGKYQFYGLTPGRYLLSLKIRAPFKSKTKPTLFYYPGGVALDQASEIAVGETDSLLDRDIKLPPGYTVRQVQGMLVWPDGSPVAGGWVSLAEAENSEDEDKKYDWTSSENDGRFSLQAFAGEDYWVHANVSTAGLKDSSGKDLRDSGGERLKARPVKVTAGSNDKPLRIVIPLPPGVEKLAK